MFGPFVFGRQRRCDKCVAFIHENELSRETMERINELMLVTINELIIIASNPKVILTMTTATTTTKMMCRLCTKPRNESTDAADELVSFVWYRQCFAVNWIEWRNRREPWSEWRRLGRRVCRHSHSNFARAPNCVSSQPGCMRAWALVLIRARTETKLKLNFRK